MLCFVLVALCSLSSIFELYRLSLSLSLSLPLPLPLSPPRVILLSVCFLQGFGGRRGVVRS